MRLQGRPCPPDNAIDRRGARKTHGGSQWLRSPQEEQSNPARPTANDFADPGGLTERRRVAELLPIAGERSNHGRRPSARGGSTQPRWLRGVSGQTSIVVRAGALSCSAIETPRRSPPRFAVSSGRAAVPLVPTLRVGMPSGTLCVPCRRALGPGRRGASKTAFPRGAWERGSPVGRWRSARSLVIPYLTPLQTVNPGLFSRTDQSVPPPVTYSVLRSSPPNAQFVTSSRGTGRNVEQLSRRARTRRCPPSSSCVSPAGSACSARRRRRAGLGVLLHAVRPARRAPVVHSFLARGIDRAVGLEVEAPELAGAADVSLLLSATNRYLSSARRPGRRWPARPRGR